ncbi:hypothetical protein ACFTZF_52305 [Streptomyces mirabilis]|uniref:hypothetical protein n=1 Tax=Streptomyces mirabilis TaxID=68239 RepID=UPI003634348D
MPLLVGDRFVDLLCEPFQQLRAGPVDAAQATRPVVPLPLVGDQVAVEEAAPDDQCDGKSGPGILPDQPYQHLQLDVRHRLGDDGCSRLV